MIVMVTRRKKEYGEKDTEESDDCDNDDDG